MHNVGSDKVGLCSYPNLPPLEAFPLSPRIILCTPMFVCAGCFRYLGIRLKVIFDLNSFVINASLHHDLNIFGQIYEQYRKGGMNNGG